MLLWGVMLIKEVGKEGFPIHLEITKLHGVVQSDTHLMLHSIPGGDHPSDRIRHHVSVGIYVEVHLVRTMGKSLFLEAEEEGLPGPEGPGGMEVVSRRRSQGAEQWTIVQTRKG